MADWTYDKLTDAVGLRGGALPIIKGPELAALLKELFTEEEARLATQMPLGPLLGPD